MQHSRISLQHNRISMQQRLPLPATVVWVYSTLFAARSSRNTSYKNTKNRRISKDKIERFTQPGGGGGGVAVLCGRRRGNACANAMKKVLFSHKTSDLILIGQSR